MTKPVWFALGVLSLVPGILGIFLPLLPTVPFVLLAAFCFSRSSERVHRWLLEHPVLGPPITAWRDNGAISPDAKRLATLSIAVVLAISFWLQFDPRLIAFQGVVLLAVLTFIWTRPDA